MWDNLDPYGDFKKMIGFNPAHMRQPGDVSQLQRPNITNHFFYVHDECSLKLLQWQFVYFFHCGSSIIMMNMKQPWLVKVPRPHSFWNLRILVGPCSIILGYSRGQVLVAKIKWNPSTRVAGNPVAYSTTVASTQKRGPQGLVRLRTSSTCSKVLIGYIHGVGGCLSPMYIYKEKGSPQNSYIIRHKKRIWKCFGDGCIMLYRWTYMNLHELETC